MRYTSNTPIVLAIIGPSGVGKSTIVTGLKRKGIISITPSVTDRPRRPGEEEIEHTFVSKQTFDRLVANNKFIGEVVQPFGLPYRYALPPVALEEHKIPLIMTRAYFIPLLSKYFPDNIVYHIEADEKFAASHIMMRKDEDIGTRLSKFSEEVALGNKYADRTFINNGQSLDVLTDMVIRAIQEDFKA